VAKPGALSESDPRWFQIAFLVCLLAYVLAFRDFSLSPLAMVAAVGAVLVTQEVCVRLLSIPHPGWLSPFISSLSLCLLLRTNEAWVAALAGVLAMASKFVLRVRGKHVFNPTNFGILAAVLLSGRAWVSPAQWGSGSFIVFFIAAAGMTVTLRATRLDISAAYLAAHAALNLGRVLWLGHSPEVFLHRFSSGALIVFAFFMISDPRATPDARAARVVFACLTAWVAYVLQFRFFVPSAPLWALLIVSPVTPVLDRLWPRARFAWTGKGVLYDKQDPASSAHPGVALHARA